MILPPAPFGFRYADDGGRSLEPDEREGRIVARIVGLHRQGVPPGRIVGLLRHADQLLNPRTHRPLSLPCVRAVLAAARALARAAA